MDSFWTQFGSSPPVADFDAEQANAMIQLLIAASFVDHHVTHAEREALAAALGSLPHYDEQQWASLEGDDGLDVITKIGMKYVNPDKREPFLEQIVAHFSDPTDAQAVLRGVVAILHADGIEGAEFEFCWDVGIRLGLQTDTIRAVISDALALP